MGQKLGRQKILGKENKYRRNENVVRVLCGEKNEHDKKQQSCVEEILSDCLKRFKNKSYSGMNIL